MSAHVEFLRRFFFSRVDYVAAETWDGRFIGPIRIESEEHFEALLTAHVLGTSAPPVEAQAKEGRVRGRFHLGSYNVAPNGTTEWLCLDFDGASHKGAHLVAPIETARLAAARATELGLSVHLERSKSGEGYHLWALFEPAIPAATARKIGLSLAPVVVLSDESMSDAKGSRGIEVFPKQGKINPGGFGNMVWLPLWAGAPDGANQFYNLDGDPLNIEDFSRNSAEVVERVVEAITPKEKPKTATNGPAKSDLKDEFDDWRRHALDRLPLETVYGQWLTGRAGTQGWLQCRVPWSPTGDQDPSGSVADTTDKAERGSFYTFQDTDTISVFDFLIRIGVAADFKGAAEEVARLSGVPRPTVKKKKETPSPKTHQKKVDSEDEGTDDGTPSTATWLDRLLRTDKEVIKVAIGNMLLIFQNDAAWKGTLGFNDRTQKVVFRRKPPADIHADVGDCLTDEHVTQTTIWLQDAYNYALKGTGLVYLSMVAAAHLNAFDPVKEWLDSLPSWDGVERADHWLSDVTGCVQSTYTAAVGAKVLISAVARVYEPGCKVDTVLILHGPQGTLKSTLLRELSGRSEWFTDHISEIGSKDSELQLCGPWIVEFSELDAITGKRESERVKSWITQPDGKFRPPYGRSVVAIPRRVIFTGTSNLEQFLRDETGGRRFLPVEIREIDITALQKMRDQLWAEARTRYLEGEKWWLEGEALASAQREQEDRRVADPWEDAIRQWVGYRDNVTHNIREGNGQVYTTASEVLTKGVKVEVPRQTKTDIDRCARILKSVLRWTRTTKKVDGASRKVWTPPIPEEGATVHEMRPTEIQFGDRREEATT